MGVMKPFQWCQFRPESGDWCLYLAAEKIEGMVFCAGHAKFVRSQMEAEDEDGGN